VKKAGKKVSNTSLELTRNEKAIGFLSERLAYVEPSMLVFAKDLLSRFVRTGRLTDKQWYWVRRLADEAKD
jgi:hypothetical protein